MNRDGNGDVDEDGGGGGRRSGGGGVLECGAGPDVLNCDGNVEDDYDEGCTIFLSMAAVSARSITVVSVCCEQWRRCLLLLLLLDFFNQWMLLAW